ncbi:Hydrogen cyanide synthase subunit HcnC [Candidatus Entotheonellaceae bacterium PAL068K]
MIGAGIVGSVLAFNLSRRHVDLTVIDQAQPGSGASSHSFAWLNAFGKEPSEYHDLNRRSMNMWDRLSRRLGADIGLQWGGEITWVASDEHAKELAERVSILQSRGYASRMIDEEELRSLEPGLNLDRFVAAEYSDNDGHVDPQKVVDACLSHVRLSGGLVQANTPVSGFDLSSTGHIHAVRTPSGDIPCDAVVLSAGLGTTQLAALVGVEVAQQESPGVVGRTTPVEPVFHTVSILHTPALDEHRDKIHLRQYADGTLMIGEGSQESVASDDSQAHAEYMLCRAIHHLPALQGARITPVPVGYRPMPMDGLPILGFTEAVPNLYMAVMHSGVTLAAAVGEFASIEVVDRSSLDLLERYRLERFSRAG